MSQAYTSAAEPACLTSPKQGARRPGLQQFDSLQELLEQAGYKETRIFTPIAVKTPASPPQVSSDAAQTAPSISSPPRLSQKQQQSSKGAAKRGATPSGWFTTLWRSSDNCTTSSDPDGSSRQRLNRKQSEPALSKKGRKAVQKSWASFWENHRATDESTDKTADIEVVAPFPTVAPSPPADVPLKDNRPRLRQTPSTNNLWQGSLKHHRLATSRSFPTRLRGQKGGLLRKESYDGARVVAGVGLTHATMEEIIFKARGKRRISLRQAFGQEECGGEHTSRSTQTSRADQGDSISSIVELQANDVDSGPSAVTLAVEEDSKVSPTATPTLTLFSAAATPLLSRQDAVALRNVGCLDFAGMLEDDTTSGGQMKNLRRMRSVDALELALQKMERHSAVSKAPSSIHNTIPESQSTDSFTNEDFVNATTTTTLLADDAGLEAGSMLEEPIERSSTPRLVITSPTGMRPPQPLVLEGQEFEPRSISPETVGIVRPVASRRSGWRLKAVSSKSDGQDNKGGEEAKRGRELDNTDVVAAMNSQVPRRSSSKKKARAAKSREGRDESTSQMAESQLVLPTKSSRKRLSRSCNNLRENALAQLGDGVSMAGKLSGSEQIRALRRDLMKRTGGARPPQPLIKSTDWQAAEVGRGPGTRHPDGGGDGEDDPFSDFVAITASSQASRPSSHVDRSGMSPIPFEPTQRRPLSATQQYNVQRPNVDPSSHPGKTLNRKTSGVGLACLVEKQAGRVTSPAMANKPDENATSNSLLDSPTAHVLKKRSSRTRIGQR